MSPPRSSLDARDSDPQLLFAYGTLRKGSAHPMAQRLLREGEWMGSGSTEGRLLLVQDSPAARYPGLIEGAGRVLGDLFRVPSVLLERLDAYEGCSENDPKPHPYVRIRCTIQCESGESLDAWTYLYTAIIGNAEAIPDGDFLAWSQGE